MRGLVPNPCQLQGKTAASFSGCGSHIISVYRAQELGYLPWRNKGKWIQRPLGATVRLLTCLCMARQVLSMHASPGPPPPKPHPLVMATHPFSLPGLWAYFSHLPILPHSPSPGSLHQPQASAPSGLNRCQSLTSLGTGGRCDVLCSAATLF